MDASSAIILAKAGLSATACEIYHIIMPPSVFFEIAGGDRPGAADYRQLACHSRIEICDAQIDTKVPEQKATTEKRSFGTGEADLLDLYRAGAGDFLIIDDGAAARYCLREEIPFINALLFPRVLEAGRLSSAESLRLQLEIIKHGRYAEDVVEFARRCPLGKLDYFLP